ncbi:MAG: hypothetical protein BWK78_06150 [Thiotrichaceae bacterium IS1]|nr:MAG: hypothetical protein BWK78_06150 [Thiotrichaceae bacterium IS1]
MNMNMKKSLKVLLVERKGTWQDILREKIGQAMHQIGATNTLVIAETANEGLNTLSQNGWNLLITDIGLGSPQKPGAALVARAHELKIPCLVVSGVANTQDINHFFSKYEINGYFDKGSFDSTKFIESVTEAL